MIQRKQTLFLLAAFLLSMGCLSLPVATIEAEGMEVLRVFNLCVVDGSGHWSLVACPLMVLLLPAALLSLVTIFLYKRRPLQARLTLVNAVALLLWYAALAVLFHRLGGTPRLSWAAALPMLSAIFLVLARISILADERLVRSADRIR